MTRLPLLMVVLLWSLVSPLKAMAFSDPALYAESPLKGGGGGRYFTGSALDGYTCSVCHSGGTMPSVSVSGLPLDGYMPGETYEVVVSWTEPEISHALTLEISADEKGLRDVSLPSASKVGADGRCEHDKNGEVAAYLLKEEERTIVGVSDCGAASLTFRFKASKAPSLRLSASVVRSDSSATPQGDGVYELSVEMKQAGATEASAGSCAVRGSSSRPWSSTGLWVLFALWWSRRRTLCERRAARRN